MSRSGRVCSALVVCTLVVFAAVWAAAQAPGPGAVQVNVVVTDKAGNPVAGLSQQQFTITDNGQARPIVSFQAYPDAAQPDALPVNTIILLDTLNMDPLQVAQARTAIAMFLRQSGDNLLGPTSVYTLGQNGIDVQIKPSTDGKAMADQLNQITTHNRGVTRSTGHWGDLERFNQSLQALGAIVQSAMGMPGRKLLIWVGPGWPLLYGQTSNFFQKDKDKAFEILTTISGHLREEQITLYSVSIGNPDLGTTQYQGFLKGVKSSKDTTLSNLNTKVFAVQSGGLVLGPDQDLARQIGICQQDASAYYTITFSTVRSDKPDEYHDIQVQMDKPELKARTDTGYYAGQ